MFDHLSRYASTPIATLRTPTGRTISYVRRRFLPRGADLPLLAEVSVQEAERIDGFAYRTLGDPQAYWRICDANDAMNPAELVEDAGRRLRVPVPTSE